MDYFILAAACAYFIKGLCGFANTLVFTSILGFSKTNIEISPVELVLSYPSNIILVLKNRDRLQWRAWLPVAITVLLGSFIGVNFLRSYDASSIKIFFGFVVFFIGLEMLLQDRFGGKHKEVRLVSIIVGIASGLLCGLYGIGALLGAYMGKISADNSSFQANLNMVFFIETTVRLALYGWYGIITLQTLTQSLMLYPFMLAALFLGMKSGSLLNEKYVRKIVMLMLIVSGIVLVISNW